MALYETGLSNKWNFNQSGSGNVNDSIGSFNLTNSGAASTLLPDGTSYYYEFAPSDYGGAGTTSTIWANASTTLEIFIKWSTSQVEYLFTRTIKSSGKLYGWRLFRNSSNKLELTTHTNNTTSIWSSTKTDWVDGRWYHIVIRWNRTTGDLSCWVDGAQESTATGKTTAPDFRTGATTYVSRDGYGASPEYSNVDWAVMRHWAGTILTDTQVQDNAAYERAKLNVTATANIPSTPGTTSTFAADIGERTANSPLTTGTANTQNNISIVDYIAVPLTTATADKLAATVLYNVEFDADPAVTPGSVADKLGVDHVEIKDIDGAIVSTCVVEFIQDSFVDSSSTVTNVGQVGATYNGALQDTDNYAVFPSGAKGLLFNDSTSDWIGITTGSPLNNLVTHTWEFIFKISNFSNSPILFNKSNIKIVLSAAGILHVWNYSTPSSVQIDFWGGSFSTDTWYYLQVSWDLSAGPNAPNTPVARVNGSSVSLSQSGSTTDTAWTSDTGNVSINDVSSDASGDRNICLFRWHKTILTSSPYSGSEFETNFNASKWRYRDVNAATPLTASTADKLSVDHVEIGGGTTPVDADAPATEATADKLGINPLILDIDGAIVTNCVLEYFFDDASSPVDDKMAGDHDCVINNAYRVALDSGAYAYYFGGSDDYGITTTFSEINNLQKYTIEILFYPEAQDHSANEYPALIGKFPYSSGWALSYEHDGSHVYFDKGPSPSNPYWSATMSPDIDKWVFLTLTHDGSYLHEDPVIYKNGSSITVTEWQAPTQAYPDDSSINVRIGSDNNNNFNLKGKIALIRVHKAILTPDEVLTNFNASKWRYQVVNVAAPITEATSDKPAATVVYDTVAAAPLTESVGDCEEVTVTGAGTPITADAPLAEATTDKLAIAPKVQDVDGAVTTNCVVEYIGDSFNHGTTVYNVGQAPTHDGTALVDEHWIAPSGSDTFKLVAGNTNSIYIPRWSEIDNPQYMTFEIAFKLEGALGGEWAYYLMSKANTTPKGWNLFLHPDGRIGCAHDTVDGYRYYDTTTTPISSGHTYVIQWRWDWSSTTTTPTIRLSTDGGTLQTLSLQNHSNSTSAFVDDSTGGNLTCMAAYSNGDLEVKPATLYYYRLHLGVLLDDSILDANFAVSSWRHCYAESPLAVATTDKLAATVTYDISASPPITTASSEQLPITVPVGVNGSAGLTDAVAEKPAATVTHDLNVTITAAAESIAEKKDAAGAVGVNAAAEATQSVADEISATVVSDTIAAAPLTTSQSEYIPAAATVGVNASLSAPTESTADKLPATGEIGAPPDITGDAPLTSATADYISASVISDTVGAASLTTAIAEEIPAAGDVKTIAAAPLTGATSDNPAATVTYITVADAPLSSAATDHLGAVVAGDYIANAPFTSALSDYLSVTTTNDIFVAASSVAATTDKLTATVIYELPVATPLVSSVAEETPAAAAVGINVALGLTPIATAENLAAMGLVGVNASVSLVAATTDNLAATVLTGDSVAAPLVESVAEEIPAVAAVGINMELALTPNGTADYLAATVLVSVNASASLVTAQTDLPVAVGAVGVNADPVVAEATATNFAQSLVYDTVGSPLVAESTAASQPVSVVYSVVAASPLTTAVTDDQTATASFGVTAAVSLTDAVTSIPEATVVHEVFVNVGITEATTDALSAHVAEEFANAAATEGIADNLSATVSIESWTLLNEGAESVQTPNSVYEYYYDGTDYGHTTANYALEDTFSIEWFGTLEGSSGDYPVLISAINNAWTNGWVLYGVIESTHEHFEFDDYANESINLSVWTPPLQSDSSVRHVVVTYDKNAGSNNLKIYVNGVLSNYLTGTGSPTANGTPLYFGSDNTDYEENQYVGDSYLFRIYDDVLTPAQVDQNYQYELWRLTSGIEDPTHVHNDIIVSANVTTATAATLLVTVDEGTKIVVMPCPGCSAAPAALTVVYTITASIASIEAEAIDSVLSVNPVIATTISEAEAIAPVVVPAHLALKLEFVDGALTDSSPYSNDGALAGDPLPTYTQLPSGQTVYEFISNYYQDIHVAPDSSLNNLPAFSYSSWLLITNPDILSNVASKHSWKIGIYNYDETVKLRIDINDAYGLPGTWQYDIDANYSDWFHLAFTFDNRNSPGVLNLYIDGVLQEPIEESPTDAGIIDDSEYSFQLANVTPLAEVGMNGDIGCTQLYEGLLSDAEIETIYLTERPDYYTVVVSQEVAELEAEALDATLGADCTITVTAADLEAVFLNATVITSCSTLCTIAPIEASALNSTLLVGCTIVLTVSVVDAEARDATRALAYIQAVCEVDASALNATLSAGCLISPTVIPIEAVAINATVLLQTQTIPVSAADIDAAAVNATLSAGMIVAAMVALCDAELVPCAPLLEVQVITQTIAAVDAVALEVLAVGSVIQSISIAQLDATAIAPSLQAGCKLSIVSATINAEVVPAAYILIYEQVVEDIEAYGVNASLVLSPTITTTIAEADAEALASTPLLVLQKPTLAIAVIEAEALPGTTLLPVQIVSQTVSELDAVGLNATVISSCIKTLTTADLESYTLDLTLGADCVLSSTVAPLEIEAPTATLNADCILALAVSDIDAEGLNSIPTTSLQQLTMAVAEVTAHAVDSAFIFYQTIIPAVCEIEADSPSASVLLELQSITAEIASADAHTLNATIHCGVTLLCTPAQIDATTLDSTIVASPVILGELSVVDASALDGQTLLPAQAPTLTIAPLESYAFDGAATAAEQVIEFLIAELDGEGINAAVTFPSQTLSHVIATIDASSPSLLLSINPTVIVSTADLEAATLDAELLFTVQTISGLVADINAEVVTATIALASQTVLATSADVYSYAINTLVTFPAQAPEYIVAKIESGTVLIEPAITLQKPALTSAEIESYCIVPEVYYGALISCTVSTIEAEAVPTALTVDHTAVLSCAESETTILEATTVLQDIITIQTADLNAESLAATFVFPLQQLTATVAALENYALTITPREAVQTVQVAVAAIDAEVLPVWYWIAVTPPLSHATINAELLASLVKVDTTISCEISEINAECINGQLGIGRNVAISAAQLETECILTSIESTSVLYWVTATVEAEYVVIGGFVVGMMVTWSPADAEATITKTFLFVGVPIILYGSIIDHIQLDGCISDIISLLGEIHNDPIELEGKICDILYLHGFIRNIIELDGEITERPEIWR